MDGVCRVIDANLNRLREGLRVIEDTMRFIYGDKDITAKLKDARQSLRQFIINLPEQGNELLKARDSGGDVGSALNTDLEMIRFSRDEILTANFKRVQESARVLEEYLKIFSSERAADMKKIRFMIYGLEKEIMLRLLDK